MRTCQTKEVSQAGNFGTHSIEQITTSELSTKTTQLTTFYPRFSHSISAFIVFELPKPSTDKPQ
jgi:hypothetical protein